MNKLVFVMIFLLSQIAFSQIIKDTGDFESVKVFDKINLELIPSSENKIEIKGINANEVELINKNGELKVRLPFGKMLNGDAINAKLYFKNIQAIDANEGSTVWCNTVFKQITLELSAEEGSQIEIKSDLQRAKVRAITGSTINISGNALNQEASIATGGNLHAKKLNTNQTSVTITTGGVAEVNATDIVDAQVKMGGTITIFGKPKQINQKTVLGGTIIQSN